MVIHEKLESHFAGRDEYVKYKGDVKIESEGNSPYNGINPFAEDKSVIKRSNATKGEKQENLHINSSISCPDKAIFKRIAPTSNESIKMRSTLDVKASSEELKDKSKLVGIFSSRANCRHKQALCSHLSVHSFTSSSIQCLQGYSKPPLFQYKVRVAISFRGVCGLRGVGTSFSAACFLQPADKPFP